MTSLAAISLVLLIAASPLRSADDVLQEVACEADFLNNRRTMAGEWLYLIEFDLSGDGENEFLVSSETYRSDEDDSLVWRMYSKDSSGDYTRPSTSPIFSPDGVRVWQNDEGKRFFSTTSRWGRNQRSVDYFWLDDDLNINQNHLCVIDYEENINTTWINDNTTSPTDLLRKLPSAEYKLCAEANRTGWRTLDQLLAAYANEPRPMGYTNVPAGDKLFVVQFDIFGDAEPEILITTETHRVGDYHRYASGEEDSLIWTLYSKDESGEYTVNKTDVKFAPEEALVYQGESGKPILGRARLLDTYSQFETFTEWRSVLKWRAIESFFDEASRDKWLKQHTTCPENLVVEYPAAKYKAAVQEKAVPSEATGESKTDTSDSSSAPQVSTPVTP